MNGLNGWFGRGFWKALTKVVVIAAAGSLAGPIGTMIASAAMAGWRPTGNEPHNPYVDGRIDLWTETVFIPYYQRIMAGLASTMPIDRLNALLEELYAWKSYYEFVALREDDEDEILIAEEQAFLIGEYIGMIRNAWVQVGGKGSFYPYPFNPKTYTSVANVDFDWSGAKSITAEKMIIASGPYNGGSNTGNTGGSTSTGGSTNTGGSTSTGGSKDPNKQLINPPKSNGNHTGNGTVTPGGNGNHTGNGTVTPGGNGNHTGNGTVTPGGNGNHTGNGTVTPGGNGNQTGNGTVTPGGNGNQTGTVTPGGNTGGSTSGNTSSGTTPSVVQPEKKKMNPLTIGAVILGAILLLKK